MEFICSECKYISNRKANVKTHIDSKCVNASIDIIEIEINCVFCKKSFSTKPILTKHLKICKVKKENLEEENRKLKEELAISKALAKKPTSNKTINIPIEEEVSDEIQETINDTEIAISDDSELDIKINKIFNDEEKRMFIVSFKGYLKYDPTLEFVVDIDSVWKWIGYSNKENAKCSLLKSEFLIENVNYIVQNLASQVGEASFHGGNNREIIMMTTNTFKKFCIMTGTAQSHKIHDYYIKLEHCVHKAHVEENKNFKLQLLDKDIQKEKNLTKNFDNKPIIYLATVEKDIISFGYTNDIKRRLKEHKKVYGKKFTLEYCFESLYNRELETGIKTSTDLYSLINDQLKPRIFSKKYHGENQTELIRLDSDFTLGKLYKIICRIKDSIDNNEIIKNLNVRNNELKDIIKSLTEN